MSALFVVIWAITGGGLFWPGFAMLGWGLGLAVQGFDLRARRPIASEEIERELPGGTGRRP